MKKLILLFIAMVGFSFSANAQRVSAQDMATSMQGLVGVEIGSVKYVAINAVDNYVNMAIKIDAEQEEIASVSNDFKSEFLRGFRFNPQAGQVMFHNNIGVKIIILDKNYNLVSMITIEPEDFI